MLKLGVGEKEKKRIVENMKRSEEFLLNESPNATYLRLLNQQKPKQHISSSGFPVSSTRGGGGGVSLLSSDNSPSSSSFSNGFCSSEDGSPNNGGAPPAFEDSRYQTPSPSSHHSHYLNGLCLDSGSSHHHHNTRIVNGKFVDEMGLVQNLCRMNIRDEQNGGGGGGGGTGMKGYLMDPDGFRIGICGDSLVGGSVQHDARNYSPYGCFDAWASDNDVFQSEPHIVDLSCDEHVNGLKGGFEKGVWDPMGSFLSCDQSNDAYSGFGWYSNQSDNLLELKKEQGRSWINRGIQKQKPAGSCPHMNEDFVLSQHYNMDHIRGRCVVDPLGSPQLVHPTTDLNICNQLSKSLILKQMTRATRSNGVPQSLLSVEGAGDMEAINFVDGLIMQETGLNSVNNKGSAHSRCPKKNSSNDISVQNLRGKNIKQDCYTFDGGIYENGKKISCYNPLPSIPSIGSLPEVQGYLYLMAQDQNGCRFLQRIFEEGTSLDIQIIFEEIIAHVVELTLNPFGNYVIQKLLDVCDEEQRYEIVLKVTKEPGRLISICLNTYGTRVVQKLIETLKTRQQTSLLVLALKPGFLDLTKDQNGNHVIQRCLQCLGNEENKFIFDAAAKFCVEIATHRHGCCVMQKCIAHSTGKHKERIMTGISENARLLAQDPFGNYVVQYIIELKSLTAAANLLSQFKGQYVQLSTQKFSSHVVEKCLKHFEDSRSQIIHELLSVSHFEQLLQDPYANYVIQSALAVTKGPLHDSLVEAVRPHMMLRTSPYCKRIFSRNLLRK